MIHDVQARAGHAWADTAMRLQTETEFRTVPLATISSVKTGVVHISLAACVVYKVIAKSTLSSVVSTAPRETITPKTDARRFTRRFCQRDTKLGALFSASEEFISYNKIIFNFLI